MDHDEISPHDIAAANTILIKEIKLLKQELKITNQLVASQARQIERMKEMIIS